MSLAERPKITLVGLPYPPEERPRHEAKMRSKWMDARDALFEANHLDNLPFSDSATLLATDDMSKKFYIDKLARFEVDPIRVYELARIYYRDLPLRSRRISKDKDQYLEGFFALELNVIGAALKPKIPDYLFNAALNMHHEQGHGVGFSEFRQRYYYDKEDNIEEQTVGVSGIVTIGNNERKAGFVEEGLVAMDQVDFYSQYLKTAIPRSFTPQQQQSTLAMYQTLSDTGFAPISMDCLEVATRRVIDDAGEETVHRLPTQIKQWRIATGLARLIGCEWAQISELKPSEIPDQELVEKGRKLLDHGRFVDRSIALSAIVEVIGGHTARTLFGLDAWDDTDAVNEVMGLIAYLEKQHDLQIHRKS